MNEKELLSKLHAELEYRPTAVGILYNSNNDLLIAKSVNGNNWHFPQGGVEKDENIGIALKRELYDELGITPNEISDFVTNFYFKKLDFESTRKDRRGFTKGKVYFYCHANYNGDGNFKLNFDEVYDAGFFDIGKCLDLMRSSNVGGRIDMFEEAVAEFKKHRNIYIPN